MNSVEVDPPMVPLDASTGMAEMPSRAKMRRYAAWCSSKERSSPSGARSKLYESFMVNSRRRSSPALGRGSSRNFVWIWKSSSGKSR